MTNDHQKSVALEHICRSVFNKQKGNAVGRGSIGGTFSADAVDNGGLLQILAITFAPHYQDLNPDEWNKIEELLSKYEEAPDLIKEDKEAYFKLVELACEDVQKIDEELKLRK